MATSKSSKSEVKKQIVKADVEAAVRAANAEANLVDIERVISRMAQALSVEQLPPAALASIMFVARRVKNAMDKGIEPIAKTRIIHLLKERGNLVTDKGSRRLMIDGWTMFMKPTRSGLDPKKLEALIRAKGKDPANYMNTRIVYEVDEAKANKLVDKKIMTDDELESCKYDESWTVEAPTQEE